jgi:diguanylate cyclase (GGDEF)-like protein
MIGATTLSSRVSVKDAVIVLASLGAAVLFIYEFSFFEHSDAMSAQERRVTTGELFAVTGLFIVGLIVFAFRRVQQEKRELGLRLAAEFAAYQARDEALRDPLTGMPNRRALEQAMAAALKEPEMARSSHALVLFDLNGFKAINDRYGHPVGDRVLQEIARRLSAATDGDKIAARLGGDEFAVFCPVVQQSADIESFVQAAVGIIEAPIMFDGVEHCVGAGAGIAFYPRDACTGHDLFRCADAALYRAKAEGRSAVRSYS